MKQRVTPECQTNLDHTNVLHSDDISKKGRCWSELKRTGMAQWVVCRQDSDYGPDVGSPPQFSSSINEETAEKCVEEAATVAECNLAQGIRKRKCLTQPQHKVAKAGKRPKIKQSTGLPKRNQNKLKNFIYRWPAERYKLAEQHMLDVMKAEGAVFEKPISRLELRIAAQKYIGDTGLLDHLLKHISGKLAPGGCERFRRCYNPNGVIKYWLETADSGDETAVSVSNQISPSCLETGFVPSQEFEEFKLLKEEMAKMKSDMQELLSRQKEQDHPDTFEGMCKELMRWKAKTDQHLTKLFNSMSCMQDMCKELVTWKAKIEQQLSGMSSSLNNMQTSRHTFSPTSEIWEDWLGSSNLDNIQGEAVEPWLDSTGFVNIDQPTLLQEPFSCSQPPLNPSIYPSVDLGHVGEVELLKEEMAKMKRDIKELLPTREDEDQASMTMTPDSSVTTSPKLDLNNSASIQDMLKELYTWKAKTDEQVGKISNAIFAMQTSKQ